ncbi:MAG TPA: AAA family ATPase [Alphaproteobacteria bacterium]|jgi:predicted kinase
MLVAFGGLPGTGTTTIARDLARRCKATFLRIDTIEYALWAAGAVTGDMGPAGYVVAYALAEANLRPGQTVVADSVNPVSRTRNAWRSAAASAGAPLPQLIIDTAPTPPADAVSAIMAAMARMGSPPR